MNDNWQRRLSQLLLALFVVVILSAVVFGPQLWAARDDAEAARDTSIEVKQGVDIATCLTGYDAKTRTAQDAVDDTRADIFKLVLLGLTASAVGDRAELDRIAAQTPIVLADHDVAIDAKSVAVGNLVRAAQKAHTDPGGFLEKCGS